jgi:radical SAM protein with 4Fe4S-binding SPASM domain
MMNIEKSDREGSGPPPFSAEFCPIVHPDVIVDNAGSEIILLHPREARWALINASGLHLLRSLNGSISLQRFAAQLAATYPGQNEARILADIRAFVERLYEANLLANAPLPPQTDRPLPLPKPPGLTLYITEECNLRCRHCAIVQGQMPGSKLSTDDLRRVIREHTMRYSNPGISFMGGEPLLRDDALDLLEFAATHTSAVTLGTNGLLINEARAARLARLPISIQISLDGPNPALNDRIRGQGTFHKALNAIALLCRLGATAKITLAVTLARCTLDQVRRMIDLADSLGIAEIRFLMLQKIKAAAAHWAEIGFDPEEIKRIYWYLVFGILDTDRRGKPRVNADFPGFAPDMNPAEHWCPLGNTFVVNSQGDTFCCPIHAEPEYVIGNINKTTLDAMRAGERNSQLRQRMLERAGIIEECRRCPWRNFCRAGCQAFTWYRTGSLRTTDEFCDFRRELYREHVRRRATGSVSPRNHPDSDAPPGLYPDSG